MVEDYTPINESLTIEGRRVIGKIKTKLAENNPDIGVKAFIVGDEPGSIPYGDAKTFVENSNRVTVEDWLFKEYKIELAREKNHYVFEGDDGNEKERYTLVRQAYFDRYGEDYFKNDEEYVWADTYPDSINDPAVEDTTDIEESTKTISDYEELRTTYVTLNERLDDILKKLEALESE